MQLLTGEKGRKFETSSAKTLELFARELVSIYEVKIPDNLVFKGLMTDCGQSLKLFFAGPKKFWIAKFAPEGFYKLEYILSRRKADS